MGKRRKRKAYPTLITGNYSNDPLQNEIIGFLQRVRFKRKFFGGVDEADVWKKIGELNSLYERAALARSEKTGDSDE